MFPRKILSQLKSQSKEKKVVLLLGPRQVGKTTLLKALHDELAQKHKCLFLDIDILSNYEKVSTFESLLNTLKLQGYNEKQKDFFYLFLDEFQKHPALAIIMKNVYDNCTNIKIYASGSSSLSIKNQIQESLAGRKQIKEIFPLDFEEFLVFKQEEKSLANLKCISTLKGNQLDSTTKELYVLLDEFLIFGGYPEVALKSTREEKVAVLDSIFDLYVKKDLVDYLKMDKILPMKKLIEFLAVNHGQKIKYDELAKVASLSYAETKTYIDILRETYIIEEVRPFFTNQKKELIKIPKIYFIDPGVRNYFVNNFNNISLRTDAGFLFEGFILAELLKKEVKKIAFWQDKNKKEVDIIINDNGLPLPIEVKYKKTLKSEDFRGLDKFLKTYPKTIRAYLINLAQQKKQKRVQLLLPYTLDLIMDN